MLGKILLTIGIFILGMILVSFVVSVVEDYTKEKEERKLKR